MIGAILTFVGAKQILSSQKLGHSFALVSLDLGKSTEKVYLEKEGAVIREQKVAFLELKRVKENTLYTIEGSSLKSIDFFSQDTNIFYKLTPTKDWPTLTFSSVPMHRFKTISPKLSAELMVREISPITGVVLDTCCGLGYTSILESKTAEGVVVFEKDENVLRLAEYNPYSEELFTNKKIKLKQESVLEGIKLLKKDSFDRILHDPPTVSFGKELYSKEFYKELFRVLKPKGIIYHYCPNPGKTKGTEFFPSIIKHLKEVGFRNCEHHKESSGIRAIK